MPTRSLETALRARDGFVIAEGAAALVLDRAAAPARLTAYVETVLPLDLVATEGERSLYVVRK